MLTMIEQNKNSSFCQVSREELLEINGGSPKIIVGGVLLVIFVIGVVNGCNSVRN